MSKAKKKPTDLDVAADMSDEAILRRWRDVAELYRLGMAMKSARFTGRKARDRVPRTDDEPAQ